MDQIEELDVEEEEMQSQMLDDSAEVSEINGRSPKLERNDSSEFYERSKSHVRRSVRGSGNDRSNNNHQRKTAAHFDGTPRSKNGPPFRKSNARGGNGGRGLPKHPPFHDRSTRSVQSQSSLSLGSLLNKAPSNKKIGHDDDASEAEQSLTLHALHGPLTPTSNYSAGILTSSFGKKSPDPSRARIQQISMSGAINSVPMSPDDKIIPVSESAPELLSQASGGRGPGTPSSRRAHEALHQSYFATTQEMFDLSVHSLGSDIQKRQMSRDVSMDTDNSNEFFDPIVCCKMECPTWFTSLVRGTPSVNRISRCVVNVLPCFWCCGNTAHGASSDRSVLARLNILCLFMTAIQFGMALWLFVVLFIIDEQEGLLQGFAPNVWNLNGPTMAIGILAFILMITCSCTIRVIKEVDLVGAIRHLWLMLWIIPFELFFNISLYDTHSVTEVWIRHWWLADSMSWFRGYFCEEGTELTKCLVPILGGLDYESEDAWCLANYNATDCAIVRDQAQDWMTAAMFTFYTGLAGWTTALFALMMLMVNSLERIITKPIVQKSRESNVPAWLSLPTIANAVMGVILLFSQSSLLSLSSSRSSSWIGILYLVVSGLFLASLLTGWFLSVFTIRNNGDKQTKNVAVVILIVMMAATLIMLTVIFVASLLFSGNLLDSPIGEAERGTIACRVDNNQSCTLCDDISIADNCPEWTHEEVTTIMQTQLKQSATLAAIFIGYAVSVLRFGITLRKHLSLYQIDYV